MVNNIKLLLIVILYFPLLAYSKPSLEIKVRNSIVEYGRPVYLKLIAIDIKNDLTRLRLDKLSSLFFISSQDFEYEKINIDTKKGSVNVKRQTLKLKIYPRQTGKLLTPAFTLDDTSSKQLELTIIDASNNGGPIRLYSTTSSTQVWQREQILVSLTVNTVDEFASIKLRDAAVAGVEITALPISRKWIKNKSGGQSTIKAGWSLLPLRPGKTEIELPAIEYHLNGVVRRVFHLPKLKLNIRSLPSYLPPTIPVGKISINSSIIKNGSKNPGLIFTDDLAYWKISIESKSLTPYWLPPVLRQIKSGDNIRFFPATSTRSLQPDEKSVNGRVSHTIPFKPLTNGMVDIPELKIQYFDPATGRLETLVHKTKTPLAIGMFSRIIAALFASALILILTWWLFQYSSGKIRYIKQRRHAVKQIRQATTIEDAVNGIRMFSEVEGWPANISLTNWLQRWQKRYHDVAELDRVIQLLALMHYDRRNKMRQKDSLANITRQLANIVNAGR